MCGPPFEFVGFGEQNMDRHRRGDGPAQHLLIRFGQWVTNIHQHDQSSEALSVLQVTFELLVPLLFDREGYFGKAIAGQIDYPLVIGQ